MLIIMTSIVYYFTVFFLELYMLVTAKDRAMRLQQAGIKKSAEGGSRKTEVDMSNGKYNSNPLMDINASKSTSADGESAMLQNMRDMMDVKKLDEATWGRLRSQFKDFVHSYEDISQSHKQL